jgi:hypothetical protein
MKRKRKRKKGKRKQKKNKRKRKKKTEKYEENNPDATIGPASSDFAPRASIRNGRVGRQIGITQICSQQGRQLGRFGNVGRPPSKLRPGSHTGIPKTPVPQKIVF